MRTGSSGTLIGWKSGQTTYVPLWNRMEGAWLWTQDEKKQERQKCPAGTKQTDGKNWGLVWRNRKKISQIIKDYFHLPFFLLIILWNKL
jgi:hypothetical protein